jgi:serine phosphatase RsbU (regulator of sigma subunit)
LLPLVVTLLFPHPTRSLLVPESILVAIAVLLTLLDGVAAGLIAAVLAPFFLWVFNVQPPFTFKFAYTSDIVAILMTGAITCSLVVLTGVLTRRERRATEARVRLGHEVEAQHTVILALQRALLPGTLPTVPGLTIGWHYLPGSGDQSVPIGGDWLVFVPIGANALGVAVGDVAGHGLSAVRAMAEYRFALKLLASQTTHPCEVLRRLDAFASRLEEPFMSTCVYGVLDVEAGTLTYASAGHPPPLCRRDRHVDVLAEADGPPLGFDLWAHRAVHETVVRLKDGDVIALYTDGLIERRGTPLDVGIATLSERIEREHDDADLAHASETIIDDLTGITPDDDVAIALLRFRHRGSRSSFPCTTAFARPTT